MEQLFNHKTVEINGVKFRTASRWRVGFTVPEVVMLCGWCDSPVTEGYQNADGVWYCPDCPPDDFAEGAAS